MKRTTIWTGVVLFALAMLVSSCGEKQHINLSKTSLAYTYSGGDDVFQVVADCNWEVVDLPDWITVSPSSGYGNGNVVVTVKRNDTTHDRTHFLYVVSENGKTKKGVQIIQVKADISAILHKVWFTLSDERWETDYLDHIIPESYRIYNYYSNEGFENWFFYFTDEHNGYQVHTHDGDTVYYPYTFTFHPEVDSLDICFEVIGDTSVLEDYHTVIHQLNDEFFVFSHAYRPHMFEKITTANVTGDDKAVFNINPKNKQTKPHGPLIPVE